MRGYTVVELLLVLSLLGIAGSVVAPVAGRYRDRAAVVGAREAVAGLLAEARGVAVESGSGSVRFTTDPPSASLRSDGSTHRTLDLVEFGVTLELSGRDSVAELSYDALGLGRVASQRIGLRRGDQLAELIVSSYGRVRRR